MKPYASNLNEENVTLQASSCPKYIDFVTKTFFAHLTAPPFLEETEARAVSRSFRELELLELSVS